MNENASAKPLSLRDCLGLKPGEPMTPDKLASIAGEDTACGRAAAGALKIMGAPAKQEQEE